MSDPDPESSSRLAVGSQPVNRRTRPLPAPGAEERPEVVQQRQQQLRARHALGRPLAAGPRAAGVKAPLPLAARVQAGVGVVSLSGALFVGQPLAVGVLVVIGASALAWAGRGVWRQHRPPGEAGPGALLPEAALQSLDRLLAQAAPELPAPAAQGLQAIKLHLERAQQADATRALALQDRAFVQLCVTRYLPDSLEAYLRIPRGQRLQPLAEGQPSADAALAQQLATLEDGLLRRLGPAQDEGREALLRQQRFLEQKSRE